MALLEADETAAQPATVEWRLKCIDSGTVLSEWTAVTPSYTNGDDGNIAEASATIDVPATLHAMQTGRKVEKKALCISADRGLSSEWNDEIVYEVERLNARS